MLQLYLSDRQFYFLVRCILSPRPTVANSCTNQCEWHRLRMEAIFSLKIWGSYRVYLYAEPERFDTMIICESMRIRHKLNTNWYDAVRCNKMQHEAVRWWWRINTIALWCDENMIGTNRNLHEPMRNVRSNTTIGSLRIVLQRTESQQTAGESQCECTTNRYECTTVRYEPIGTDTNWYDVRRCNMTQYE